MNRTTSRILWALRRDLRPGVIRRRFAARARDLCGVAAVFAASVVVLPIAVLALLLVPVEIFASPIFVSLFRAAKVDKYRAIVEEAVAADMRRREGIE